MIFKNHRSKKKILKIFSCFCFHIPEFKNVFFILTLQWALKKKMCVFFLIVKVGGATHQPLCPQIVFSFFFSFQPNYLFTFFLNTIMLLLGQQQQKMCVCMYKFKFVVFPPFFFCGILL